MRRIQSRIGRVQLLVPYSRFKPISNGHYLVHLSKIVLVNCIPSSGSWISIRSVTISARRALVNSTLGHSPIADIVVYLHILFSSHLITTDGCGHVTHHHFSWWNAEILKPIQKYGAAGPGLDAYQKLSTLLSQIMLRRTKLERSDDLGLPPRIVTVRRDIFNIAEEEFYESLFSSVRRTFDTYVQHNTVLNHYASIFSLLSRMRLAANHPDLVALKFKESTGKGVCVICQDPAEDAIQAKCKHVFCRADAREYILSAPEGQDILCPACFKPLIVDLSQPEMEIKEDGIVSKIDFQNWRSSTKIEALVEELEKLQREGRTEKSIVFSQFVAFLDLIAWRLARAGFNVVKLDGRMGPQQRAEVIKKFMEDAHTTVFLVSLKAGGVALNLTEASRVFVMDPWYVSSSLFIQLTNL